MQQGSNNRQHAPHPRAGLLILVPLILVAIGGFLRLAYFDQMEFGVDEVTAILTTKFWLGHGIPLFGQMSGAGVMMPPGFIFLIYPLVRLTEAPLPLCFYVACFNIAALWLIYGLSMEAGNPRGAFWVCALAAVHPWLIIYSRRIWPQCFLPFFVTLFLVVAARCTRQPRSRLIFWCGPLISLTWQIHYSAYCLLVFFLIWFTGGVFRRRVNWPWALSGFLAGGILFYPHLHFLIQSDFHSLRQAFSGGGEAIPLFKNLVSLGHLFGATAFTGGLGFFFQTSHFQTPGIGGTALGAAYPWLPPLAAAGTVGFLFLFGVGLVIRKRPQSGFIPWLRLMAVLPLFLYPLKGLKVPPWYFIISLPAVIALAGTGMDTITGAASRLLKGPAGRLLPPLLGCLICISGAITWLAFIGFVRENGGTGGMYGLTYRVQEQAAEKLVEERIPLDRIDLSLTRGKGFGIAYLYHHLNERRKIEPGGYSGNKARLIDTLFYPDERCPEGETPGRLPAPDPLLVCISAAN